MRPFSKIMPVLGYFLSQRNAQPLWKGCWEGGWEGERAVDAPLQKQKARQWKFRHLIFLDCPRSLADFLNGIPLQHLADGLGRKLGDSQSVFQYLLVGFLHSDYDSVCYCSPRS